MGVIPVFMYHHVNPNRDDMVTVTPEIFEEHLSYLRRTSTKTLTLDELVRFMKGEERAPGRCAVLTFDDGYLDNYVHAFPLLRKYGQKAAIFVVSSWAEAASGAGADGAGRAMGLLRDRPPTHSESKGLIERGEAWRVVFGWEAAREMAESGLVEIQSHTATHGSCDQLPEEELEAELVSSRRAIEKRVERPCTHLCWPRGRYNEAALSAARAAGYRGVFTTEHGVARDGGDPMRIGRIVVKDGERWFRTRLRIYTNPLLSDFYLKVKG